MIFDNDFRYILCYLISPKSSALISKIALFMRANTTVTSLKDSYFYSLSGSWSALTVETFAIGHGDKASMTESLTAFERAWSRCYAVLC